MKQTVFEKELEEHAEKIYVNADGSERNGGDDRIIDVFENFVKAHIKLAKVAGFEGWEIKDAKEYHHFGWDMFYLTVLEGEGKIKLTKMGRGKYNYLIQEAGN